ncbi:uncharacterized protein TM35_000063610 [Trypanosoma theileri]|uniref:Uncharacterized protein n=1 Tax=Trypanosoma theileri TaxID=67003 RepID=A0A1X0P329_9TRYP|nr:uncharacterized protein TM35_000063610 [Trypanosoma theileri]ORC91356.1 hypothetical protein TM35_000063610 [Trypanosoma theileri]
MSRSLLRLNQEASKDEQTGNQRHLISHHIPNGKSNLNPNNNKNNKRKKKAKHTHNETHHVSPQSIQQQLGPKPWWRRYHPTGRSLHTADNSSSVASSTSIGPHLFSAFFVTPRELAHAVRRWAIAFSRKRRKRQLQRNQQSKIYPHLIEEKKRNMISAFHPSKNASLEPPPPLQQQQNQKEKEENNMKEIALALSTARLLWASVERSTAACVDVRSTGRLLAKRCRSLVACICPMLPYTGAHKQLHTYRMIRTTKTSQVP